MPRHLSLAELHEGLPDILGSPKNQGTLAGIVVRPEKGLRREPESCELSLALGTHGDRWAKGCWKTTEDGLPHPDVQICIMNARCIALIAESAATGRRPATICSSISTCRRRTPRRARSWRSARR